MRLEDKGACIALHCREATTHEAVLHRGVHDIAAVLPSYVPESVQISVAKRPLAAPSRR